MVEILIRNRATGPSVTWGEWDILSFYMGLTTYVPVDISLIDPRLKRDSNIWCDNVQTRKSVRYGKCSLSSHPSFPFCVRLNNAEKFVHSGEFLMSFYLPHNFTKTIFITAVNLIVVLLNLTKMWFNLLLYSEIYYTFLFHGYKNGGHIKDIAVFLGTNPSLFSKTAIRSILLFLGTILQYFLKRRLEISY